MIEKGKKVFFSYAESDRNPAQKVARQLRDAGFDVWDPDTEILPGSDWTSDFKKALDSAGALVVFISPEGMASRLVSYEIDYALGAKHLSRRLFPVVLRPTDDIPWILSSLKSVKYETPTKTGRELVKLLS